ncbi:hypothetical protein F4809DRAFT_642075 [Biscogniauxia mediterranea]|nr:hypothetical protein F4809DRAFT_642075 [Biscogniauxia mediterranea]
MRNSPHLRENNGPIILVGHSMGGLVIKKAFILSEDMPDFDGRIQCIFFIATPHQDSNYASILNNILAISGVLSPRQYIADLTTGSISAQLINEEFVRTICKLDSPEDPGYITLRNALASATQDILKGVLQSKIAESRETMQSVESFLGVMDHPNEHHIRAEGSCQWIDNIEDFQDWRDSSEDPLHEEQSAAAIRSYIFWMYANPGTGKTFLASHVIDEHAQFGMEHAYYFFHCENRTSSSLSGFLRSVAYQMAFTDAAVLDAIDECNKYQEFFALLKSLQLTFPLRIFITSRKVSDMQKLHRSLDASATVVCREIVPEDLIHDIERYIHDRAERLPVGRVSESEDLVTTLCRRANACFLWVRLVLDELETVYSNESILQVLESIPEGMVPYYERTVRVMSENKREKHIAKALSQALELDIGAQFGDAKSAVEGLCGQLVLVDEQSGLMRLVHPTARESRRPSCCSIPTLTSTYCLVVYKQRELSLNPPVPCGDPATRFRILQFAPGGSSVIDVVNSGMRKWTPAILIQRNIEEGQDVGSDAPDIAATGGEHEMMRGERITALRAVDRFHREAWPALVKDISVSKTNVVASSDVNGIVQVVGTSPYSRWLEDTKFASMDSDDSMAASVLIPITRSIRVSLQPCVVRQPSRSQIESYLHARGLIVYIAAYRIKQR